MKTEGFVLILGLSRVPYYYSGRSQKMLNIALIAEVGVDTTNIFFDAQTRCVEKGRKAEEKTRRKEKTK